MANLDFTDHTIVITGAASGIGLAIAEAFAEHGANLELIDRNPDALEAAAQRLAKHAKVTTHALDLTNAEQIHALADNFKQRQITIHALINNAGMEYPTPLNDAATDAEQRWQSLLHNNVSSMYLLTRALLPFISSSGCVINQSSIWGMSAVADFSAYVTSKHAVIGLTRSLAWELGKLKIRVNAVCPGWVATEAAMRSMRAMAETADKSESEMIAEILAQQAIPELLMPADIAGTFLFLASPYARAITGQAIVVSNGEVMH
ncbi:SDR family NAD(P)-dependent oxidoreductase [Sulfuriferula nivalis]|uniref:3-hydroxyacyl-CoA dehydrogenase n=1 Tax=Sulfuriferula nivalis TaxID=2675298 RepID=A0A809RFT3_9PROT|nr:SDR family oxidoreductase [Sulfuriferula nivalis]BBP00699.1 3-hydroxyacyl-CoA dehydrogenase [Sulfuriferula nivalis]